MTQNEYSTKLFEKEGFRRKKCVKCAKYFWTQGKFETCGDPPCDDYSFIGNSAIEKKYTLKSMREAFLEFFEKKGHTRISRYPVVARWRDDILYTGASIYCFQPWVINRTVDPPENPLTMSQPSIRFGDIDNVGKSGRHCSIFEMMAHHAFNTEDNTIYWKDELISYAHEFATSLGIPSEEIIYKEYPWAGGGNAGPAYEMMVRGLEIATLVLMQYERNDSGDIVIDGEKYSKMPMQVIDTGYGLERWVWLSQGTPTLYDCIHKPVIDFLKEKGNIDMPDTKILSEYSKLAGLYDINSNKDLIKIRKEVANRLNMSLDEISKFISPFENIYAIADFTKTITFALGDSVVPSNVKEGYLMRLLIRKAIRSLQNLNLSIPLTDIVKIHIDDLSDQFPEFRENQKEILELVDVEEKKFHQTLKRGKKLVQRHIKKNKLKKIPESDLKLFWHTHGLLPENVAEFSDVEVEIPDDFTTKVAKESDEQKEKRESKIEGIDKLEDTEILYHKPIFEFRAKVIYSKDNYVVLDKSAFYPTSGGQINDVGYIGRSRVLNVEKFGQVIVHEVDELPKNKEVLCKIDKNRRSTLTKHHTATHIINAAAKKVLGNHIWQTGAYKEMNKARLDITHYENLSKSQLREIENVANDIVNQNIKIEKFTLERNEAESRFGFRIYQGGAVPGKFIRIVKISDLDIEACGGTHCDYTSEVGKINIIRSERIQDGVVRLEYSSDKIAWNYLKEREAILKKVAEVFDTDEDDIIKVAKRFFREWKSQKKEIEKLKKKIAESKSKSLEFEDVGRYKVFIDKIEGLDVGGLRKLAKKSTKENSLIFLANEDNFFVVSSSRKNKINAKELIDSLNSKFRLKGGGSDKIAQGKIIQGDISSIKGHIHTLLEK